MSEQLMQCPKEVWLLRGPKELPELHKFDLLEICGLYMNGEKEFFKPIYGLDSKHGLVLRKLSYFELNKHSDKFKKEPLLESDRYFFSGSGKSASRTVFVNYQNALATYTKVIEKIINNLQQSVADYKFRIKKMEKEKKKAEEKQKAKSAKVSKLDDKRKQKKKEKGKK